MEKILNEKANEEGKLKYLINLNEILEYKPNLIFEDKNLIFHLSNFLSYQNSEISILATKILLKFALGSNNQMSRFEKLFLKFDFNKMNERLECIALVNIFFNNFIMIQGYSEEINLLKNSINSEIWQIRDNFNSIYDQILKYILENYKEILYPENHYVADLDLLYCMLIGLFFNKIFSERPLVRILSYNKFMRKNRMKFNFNLNSTEIEFLCKNLKYSEMGKFIFIVIHFVFCRTNKKMSVKQNDLIILLNEMKMGFKGKVEDTNKISDEVRISKEIFEIKLNLQSYLCVVYFDFIINYFDIGFEIMVSGLKNNNLWINIYRVIVDKIENENFKINSNVGVNELMKPKILKLFFEKFAETNHLVVNHLKGFRLLFINCDKNKFSFLENFIEIIAKEETDTEEKIEKIFLIIFEAQNFLNKNYFNQNFLSFIEGVVKNENRDKIFEKLFYIEKAYKFCSEMYKINFELDFLLKYTKILDKHNYLNLFKLFRIFAKFTLNNYDQSHDILLHWIISKYSNENKSTITDECLKELALLVQFLDERKNPKILEFLNSIKNELLPNLFDDLSNYDVYDEEERNSNFFIKDQIHDESSTNLNKEQYLKEKFKVIIKNSQEKRDYYEEIFHKLIKFTKKEDKNMSTLFINLLCKKISKCLYSLNRECLDIDGFNMIMQKNLDYFFKIIQNENFSAENIILKAQLNLTYNCIKLTVVLEHFKVKKIDLVKLLIENSIKSVYVEMIRICETQSNKNLSIIKENEELCDSGSSENVFVEKNNKITFDNNSSFNPQNLQISSDRKFIESMTSIELSNESIYSSKNSNSTEFKSKENKTIGIISNEINEDSQSLSHIISQDNLDASLIGIMELNFSDLSETSFNLSDKKESILNSQISSIFNLSGYINLINKSIKEFRKDISLLMKSDDLSKYMKEKFSEYLQLIIALEKFYVDYKRDKGQFDVNYKNLLEKFSIKNFFV